MNSDKKLEPILKPMSINEKFISIQNRFPKVEKRGSNPHFKSKYMLFSDILNALRKLLREYDMGLVQRISYEYDGTYLLVTKFISCDDEITFTNSFKFNVSDPQKFGSMLTYVKRYALTACLGLDADIDDDGNVASSGGVKDLIKYIQLIIKKDLATTDDILKELGLANKQELVDLDMVEADDMINHLKSVYNV